MEKFIGYLNIEGIKEIIQCSELISVELPLFEDSSGTIYAEYFKHDSFKELINKVEVADNLKAVKKLIKKWKKEYGILPGIELKKVPDSLMYSKKEKPVLSTKVPITVTKVQIYKGSRKEISSNDFTFSNQVMILPENKHYVGGSSFLTEVLDEYFEEINSENIVEVVKAYNSVDAHERALYIYNTFRDKNKLCSDLEEQRLSAEKSLVLKMAINNQFKKGCSRKSA